MAKNFKIAGGHRDTVSSAENILKSGGNAFDAAISGVFSSMVCEYLSRYPMVTTPVVRTVRVHQTVLLMRMSVVLVTVILLMTVCRIVPVYGAVVL